MYVSFQKIQISLKTGKLLEFIKIKIKAILVYSQEIENMHNVMRKILLCLFKIK